MKNTAIIYLSAILAMSSPAIALAGGADKVDMPQYPHTTTPFGNFYVGANIGRDSTGLRYTRTNTNSALNREYKDESLQGWAGGLFTGYSFNITPRYFVGLEGFYRWDSSRFSFTEGTDSTTLYKYKKSYELGASLLPGMHLGNENIYIRAGWVRAKFTRNAESTARASAEQFNKKSNGIQLGLGIKNQIINHLFLQMDYIYSYFQKFHNTDNAGNDDNFYRPISNQFLLGLMYEFGHHASNASKQAHLKMSSLYAGIEGIYNATRVITIADRGANADETWDRLIRGGKIGMNLGYSRLFWKHFYFGEEASLQFLQTKYTHDNNHYSLRDGFRYGLSVVPGYAINQSNILFTKLGWQRAKFKKSGNEATGTNRGPNFSTYKNGLMLGLGFETALTSTLSLKTEYDYTRFARIRNTRATTEHFTYKPQSSQYIVGLSYHF